MILSEEQKKCLYTDKNIIVSAGAGSGKTTVLAHRFLALVKKGIPAHKILTLTFTRKATAEMEERILRLLYEHQTHALVKSALSATESLNISTLDSFCLKILQNGARTFNLPSTFSTNEYQSTLFLEKSCQKFIYEHSHHPILRRLLLQRKQIDPFNPLLHSLFIPLAKNHCPFFPEKTFSQRSAQVIEWIHAQAEEQKEKLLMLLKSLMMVATAPLSKTEKLQEYIKQLLDNQDYLGISRHLYDLNLNSIRDSSPASRDMRDMIQQFRGGKSKKSDSPLSFFLQAEMLRTLEEDYHSFYTLLTEFQEYICKEKLNSEQLSFNDVMNLALHILREDRSIRLYFQQSFDAIIADEFQDNNRPQHDLLLLLAQDPQSETYRPHEEEVPQGKLFLVGDERQSIYRFRGAEVKLFQQLRQRLTESGGTQVHLSANYRSTPLLVEFFNTLFQKIFPAPPMVSALPAQSSPKVILAYAEAEEQENPHEREALWVANRISMLLKENEQTASDIAILLPTTTHKRHFEHALQGKGISFYSSSTHSLFQESPANDLYHLMDLLFYPQNRESYAVILRSPLINLSDEALLRILDTGRDPFSPQKDLSEKDQEKYTQAQAMFRRLQVILPAMNPASFLHYFWYRLGYRYYALESPSRHGLLNHYDFLLTLATACETMGKFYVTLREKIPVRQEEPHTEGVQIMTIHASKGLEFPVVFICDMANSGKKENNQSVPYLVNAELGPIINIPPPKESNTYLFLHKKIRDHQEKVEELHHLLYVSTTRAASRLFYTASLPKRALSPTSLFSLLKDILNFSIDSPHTISEEFSELIDLLPIPAQKKETKPLPTLFGDHIQKMLDHTPPPLSMPPPRYLSVTFLNSLLDSENSLQRPSPSTKQRRTKKQPESLPLGILSHSILEWRLQHPNHPIDHNIPEFHSLLEEILPQKRESLLNKALTFSEKFFSSQFWIDHQHLPRESEVDIVWKYTEFSPHYLITGRIDLLIDKGSEKIVLDFKTDSQPHAENYALQMALYRQAVHRLTGKPVKVFLAFLHSQKIIPAPAINLEEVLLPLFARIHRGEYGQR